MPHAAVRAWKQALVHLAEQQSLQQSNPASKELDRVAKAVDAQIIVLGEHSEATSVWPRAAWKTLIRDMEVPYQIAAWSSLQPLPMSNSPAAVCQAWKLLHLLLRAAVRDIFPPRTQQVSPGVERARAPDATVLGAAFVQQLQQAYTFERCAAAMGFALALVYNAIPHAEAIAAAAAAVVAAPAAQGGSSSGGSGGASSARDGGSGSVQSSGNNIGTSSSDTDGSSGSGSVQGSGTNTAAAGSTFPGICLVLMDVAAVLLALQHDLGSGVWCDIVHAYAELAIATLQFLDAWVRMGAGLVNTALPSAVVRAVFIVMRCMHLSHSSQQLLQSESVRQTVTLAVLLVHTELLLPAAVQQEPATGGSSSPGGQSSSSSNPRHQAATSGSGSASRQGAGASGSASAQEAGGMPGVLARGDPPGGSATAGRHALGAWEAARQLELEQQGSVQQGGRLLPLLMSLCIVRLRTVAWMAGWVGDESSNLEATASAVCGTPLGVVVGNPESEEQQQQQAGSTAAPDETLAELLAQLPHRLLLAQLLLLAVQQRREQQQQRGEAWVRACRYAAMAADQLLTAVPRLCSAQDCQLTFSQVEELQEMMDSWVGQAMPVVVQLMAGLLEEAEADEGAGAAATPPAAAAAAVSSRSSSSSSRLSHTPVAAALAEASQATAGLQDCVTLLCSMGYWGGWLVDPKPLVLAAAEAAGSGASESPGLKAWCEHSTAISAALEEAWRVYGRHGASSIEVADLILDLPRFSYLLGERGPLLLAAKQAGPGSRQQRQLFSMLCSLFKLCSAVRTFDTQAADTCVFEVIYFAVNAMLCELDSQQQEQQQQQPAAGQAAPAAAVCGTAAAAASSSAAAVAAAAAAAQLQLHAAALERIPWLVLLGRCFLLWGWQLQQLQQSQPNLGQLLLQARAQAGECKDERELAQMLAGDLGVHASHPAVFLLDWVALLSGGMWGQGVQDLAAAGYPTLSVAQHADAAAAATRALAAAEDAGAVAPAFAEFAAQVRALGGVLNTLAVPHACNNPVCASMAGPSELASVSGRSNLCGGCRVARYCGRPCQGVSWKQHKPVCRALAAAAATPTAAAGQAGQLLSRCVDEPSPA